MADPLTDLIKLAKRFATNLTPPEKKQMGKTLKCISTRLGSFKVSSSCSGSELQMLVGKSVAIAFFPDCDYFTMFSCEKEAFKQRWIRGMHKQLV